MPKPYNGKGCPRRWIDRVRTYCHYYSGMTTYECILLASNCLDDSAYLWFNSECDRVPDQPFPWNTLDEFLGALQANFTDVTDRAKAEFELMDLRQTSSVQEYEKRFFDVILRLPRMSETEKYRIYLRGLEPEIKQKAFEDKCYTLDGLRHLAESKYSFMQLERKQAEQQNRRPRPRPQQRSWYPPPQAYRPQQAHAPPFISRAPPRNPDAMDVDNVNLSSRHHRGPLTQAQREWCVRNRACFYCRQLGHNANKCPEKARAAVAINEIEISDPYPEEEYPADQADSNDQGFPARQ